MRSWVTALLLVCSAPFASSEERVVLESGGWELIGTWRVPPGDASAPAALLLHKAAGSRAEYRELAEALAARGIASLRLDLRGHGESDNLGRFEEPYAEHRSVLAGTHEDITTALRWIETERNVDADRLAIVAASYSGEAVGAAIRAGTATASAYVMLSPGSFSEDSVALVDASAVPWLFVRTSEESPASVEFIDAVFEAVRSGAETAETRVIPGAGHATDILDAHPFVVAEIADWLARAMGSEGR